MEVERKLREYIQEHGIKMTHLAKRIGLRYEQLQRSMAGYRKLSADEFVAVLKELKLEVKDIEKNEVRQEPAVHNAGISK